MKKRDFGRHSPTQMQQLIKKSEGGLCMNGICFSMQWKGYLNIVSYIISLGLIVLEREQELTI